MTDMILCKSRKWPWWYMAHLLISKPCFNDSDKYILQILFFCCLPYFLFPTWDKALVLWVRWTVYQKHWLFRFVTLMKRWVGTMSLAGHLSTRIVGYLWRVPSFVFRIWSRLKWCRYIPFYRCIICYVNIHLLISVAEISILLSRSNHWVAQYHKVHKFIWLSHINLKQN